MRRRTGITELYDLMVHAAYDKLDREIFGYSLAAKPLERCDHYVSLDKDCEACAVEDLLDALKILGRNMLELRIKQLAKVIMNRQGHKGNLVNLLPLGWAPLPGELEVAFGGNP